MIGGRNRQQAHFDWHRLKPTLPIIGVDEVGRGCLAGPVYAAAVLLDTEKPWNHFTDSKKLSATRREIFAEQIRRDHAYGIGFADVEEIAELNILWASLEAMKRAVLQLVRNFDIREAHLLVDGNQSVPGLEAERDLKFIQTTLVKGDLRAEPIAAASILAKVTRDRLLTDLADRYPGYGLENHKGYATTLHQEAIARLGPCAIHRRTFAGVREFWPPS